MVVLVLGLIGICDAGEPAFELLRVIEVQGRQGVATDGNAYFVSGSRALYMYDKQGQLLASNETPFDGMETEANHIGDISVHDGELYAGIEHFLDGKAANIRIAVFDAKTLEYRRAIDWNPASGQVEVSAVAIDSANDAIWMTDWTNGAYVFRYSLSTGHYAGKMHLDPAPSAPQGVAIREGYLYITADDGNAETDEADGLWQVRADPDAREGKAVRIRAFAEFRRAGEVEGLDFDPTTGEMVVLNNRGERIVLGMPSGLYPGYDREIHELYVYRLR
ncbi:MAG: hypothetical protein OEV63_14630 [Gammaproteobacteria bacterium]|nr:hypothetical protein [Gammaproteobacteria bacterium]MDH5215476.1 hypothetical protein [Gammaproteobacteria bacterium]MDH5500349.1 hypothetical protein [Gammaproteobacteria bacterium]